MKTPVDRRTFLKFASVFGLSFTASNAFSSNLDKKQLSQQPGRIDVHHYILPPVYTSALSKTGVKTAGGVRFRHWNAQKSIGVMDRNGIASVVTRIGNIRK